MTVETPTSKPALPDGVSCQSGTLHTDSSQAPLQRGLEEYKIAQYAISASTLYELAHRATSQIVELYLAECAAIYLLDDTGLDLILQHAVYREGQELGYHGHRIKVGSQTGVGQAAAKNHPIVNADISPTAHNASAYLLAETRSEVSLPITSENQMLGVLNVQSYKTGAFDADAIHSLQAIAGYIAPVVQHFQSQETTQAILGELSTLYQASQSMAQARTEAEILKHAAKTLKQAPCQTYLLKSESDGFRLILHSNPDSAGSSPLNPPEFVGISPTELEHSLFTQDYLITSAAEPATGEPDPVRKLASQLGFETATFIPVWKSSRLDALIVLDAGQREAFSNKNLQLYMSLANITSTALDKVQNLESIEKRLDRLQVLDSVSQAITLETDVDMLYKVIHEQITRVMGEINFLIALYDPATDTVEIPYAYEEDHVLSIPSFPLGEGLTSILIRTKQPLLLGGDAGKRAAELGARVVGVPAKSWLGVPLLVGGDAIGAIIIQDLQREDRFDEGDQRLLSNLATQVAITVRNARLLQETRLLAERESAAKEITTKLWSSSDIDSILRTALYELGHSLNAARGFVQLELEETAALPIPGRQK